MFPHLLPLSERHPRFLILIGFAVFISAMNLWMMMTPVQRAIVSDVTTINAADAQTLLIPPTTDAAVYEQKVQQYAVQSDTITVSEHCVMNPLVVKLPQNSVLKIDNRDTTTHTVAFEDQNFFNVEAGQTRELNITETFGKGAGIYRYKCNDISLEDNVGVMYVTE